MNSEEVEAASHHPSTQCKNKTETGKGGQSEANSQSELSTESGMKVHQTFVKLTTKWQGE